MTADPTPQKCCPKCGAAFDARSRILNVDGWGCGSRERLSNGEFSQSDKCRIAELTRENERLRGMLQLAERRLTHGDTANGRYEAALKIREFLNKKETQ